MLENNLIQKCVCGNQLKFRQLVMNELDVLECEDCKVIHQAIPNFTYEDYIKFYQYQYHEQYQEKKGVVSYSERYEHDCKIANLRLDAYSNIVFPGMRGLDIGSSNSAFVHCARNTGIDCIGLEPGDKIGDDSVTIRGTVLTADIEHNQFDFITMHDSIEHIVDTNAEMIVINKLLKTDGILIVDLPDYFSDDGRHHWKKIEHLWIFRKEDLEKFLLVSGFKVFEVKAPIPGKFVFYARKI